MNVEQARDAENAATAEVDRLASVVRAECREAEAAIRAKWAPEIEAARIKAKEARAVRIAAEDAGEDHEWHGKRVYREVSTRRWGWEQNAPKKREEGIVDTFRSTTPTPENMPAWRKPQIGAGIVRALKKDGTPGKKFETLPGFPKWKLVEADAPNPIAQNGES